MRQYYVCLLKSIETLFFSHVITSLQDDGNDFAAARSSFAASPEWYTVQRWYPDWRFYRNESGIPFLGHQSIKGVHWLSQIANDPTKSLTPVPV
jgi:hypothetical protein